MFIVRELAHKCAPPRKQRKAVMTSTMSTGSPTSTVKIRTSTTTDIVYVGRAATSTFCARHQVRASFYVVLATDTYLAVQLLGWAFIKRMYASSSTQT
jgi:hypothetical protein